MERPLNLYEPEAYPPADFCQNEGGGFRNSRYTCNCQNPNSADFLEFLHRAS